MLVEKSLVLFLKVEAIINAIHNVVFSAFNFRDRNLFSRTFLHQLELVATWIRVHLVKGVLMTNHLRCSGHLTVKLWHNLIYAAQCEILRLFYIVVLILSRWWSLLPADTRLKVLVFGEHIVVTLCMPLKVHWM